MLPAVPRDVTPRKLITAVAVAVALVFPVGNTILNLVNFRSVHNAQHRLSMLAHSNATLVKRVAADEHQTCVIQARGLPAGHQLAATLRYVYVLLTLPPAPNAVPTPPKIEQILLHLDSHLARYLAAESKQPPTRSC